MGALGQARLIDFCEQVAAKTPTPGGGSVCAAASAMGVSVGIMAARFSEGDGPAEAATKLNQIKESFLGLVDADAEAYDLVLSARGLPKGTTEEQGRRAGALENALVEAADVPLRGMRLCVEGLGVLRSAAKQINRNLAVDLGVSAGLLEACLNGCELNVQINARCMKGRKEAGKLSREAASLAKKGKALAAQVAREARKLYAGK